MKASAPSTVNTVNVPVQGTDPAILTRAADRPLRVLVRNVGGALIAIAYDANALAAAGPVADTFRLPAGTSETFVLMPQQALLAAGIGAGGLVSLAVSEALPQVWMET